MNKIMLLMLALSGTAVAQTTAAMSIKELSFMSGC